MQLSEELEAIQEVAREFTRRELIPLEQSVIEREIERGFDSTPLISADE